MSKMKPIPGPPQVFEVEQFIVCVDTYRVVAEDEKQAAKRVRAGEGVLYQGSEYERVATGIGKRSIGTVRALRPARADEELQGPDAL